MTWFSEIQVGDLVRMTEYAPSGLTAYTGVVIQIINNNGDPRFVVEVNGKKVPNLTAKQITKAGFF